MSRTLISDTQPPLFHPSQFETTMADTPQGTRSIRELEREHTKRLDTDDLNHLQSPGSFHLTAKLNDEISDSNKKYMTRTLFEDSLLSFLFFSKKNVENIQNIIKHKVYKSTNKIIDDQNTTELLIIMRSIYLEYSAHPPLLKDDMDEKIKQQILVMYTNEVQRLNGLVIDYVYPTVLSGLQQYIMYLKDASTLPYQQQQPVSSDNVKGQRVYRSVTQVLLGTDL
jgi:hypothetical protein